MIEEIHKECDRKVNTFSVLLRNNIKGVTDWNLMKAFTTDTLGGCYVFLCQPSELSLLYIGSYKS